MKLHKNTIERVVGCRSDFEVGQLLGSILIDGYKGLTELDAESLRGTSEDADSKAKRFELITAVRGGKHAELSVTALTFRQRKTPNRRYLRLGAEKLAERAPSWRGLPYLVDHNTHEMDASKGTILSSKLVQESANVAAFEQQLHVVKPDAVIGFLDGTYKRFSIGWFPIGPVLCSAHGCDIRGLDSCSCWPGDKVLVDGKPQIVEYVFSDFEGKETSSVVIPAVKDTSVEDMMAALAAELDLPPTRIANNRNKENRMRFTRLAAALGLAALADTDEDSALAAVEALTRRAATAESQLATVRIERDTARTSLVNAEAALTTATAAAKGVQIDAILKAQGYAVGKLRYGKDAEGKQSASPMEPWLRSLAAQPNGLELLKTQLGQMPEVVPVGKRPASDDATNPTRLEIVADDEELTVDNPYIQSAAAQMGLKPEEMVTFAKNNFAGGQ